MPSTLGLLVFVFSLNFLVIRGQLAWSPKLVSVYDVKPLYGPQGGGTVITITGRGFGDVTIVRVRLESDRLQINRTISDENHIVGVTPYFFSGLDQNLSVILEYDEDVYDTGFDFHVRPSPIVLDIEPKSAIISGGLPVTIIGKNFDNVHDRSMRTALVYNRRPIPGRDYTTFNSIYFWTPCALINSTRMTCETPEIKMPKDLKKDSVEDLISKGKVELYVECQMDGVGPKGDPIDLPPGDHGGIQMRLQVNPTFFVFEEDDETLELDRKKIHRIEIRGRDVRNGGATSKHYRVNVGIGRCINISLFDNRLECQPPTQQPAINVKGNVKTLPRVQVLLGNNIYHIGYLRYVSSRWTIKNLNAYIIGGIVGGVILILLLVVICIVTYRKRNSARTRKHKAQPDIILGRRRY